MVSALEIGLGLLSSAPGFSEIVTGTLGEPGTKTTLEGNQLPAPAPKFGGAIKDTLDGSKV